MHDFALTLDLVPSDVNHTRVDISMCVCVAYNHAYMRMCVCGHISGWAYPRAAIARRRQRGAFLGLYNLQELSESITLYCN